MTATDTVQDGPDAATPRPLPRRPAVQAVLAAILAVAPAVTGAPALAQATGAARARTSPAAVSVPQDLAARLDSAAAILEAHRRGRGIPGLSAAIAIDGRLVWSDGFGFADLQNRAGAWAETRYRIASISKPIAAVAAMQLVEDGAIDLDAPIQRYVPEFPEKRAPVTLRRLMSHTAGIRHYRGDEFMSDVRYTNVFDPLDVFMHDSLLFAPGEDYSYSTYGFTVVSAAVAGASGQRFVDYVDRNVIRPLGLRTLQPEWRDSIIPHHASFYEREDGRLVNATPVDLSNKWAGGGYISTAADLVRFALGLLDGRLLRPATVDSMFTPQRLNDGSPVDYGLAWRTEARNGEDDDPPPGARREIWHTGGAMGGSGVLLLYPDDGVVVSILANLGGGGHTGPARRIAELFLEPRPAAAASPTGSGR